MSTNDMPKTLSRRSALTLSLAALSGACAHREPERDAVRNTESDLRQGQHALSLLLPGQARPQRLWLHLPPGYLGGRERWPLLVFLHGSGERGESLDAVKVHGPPKLVAAGADYPCILASPLLEADGDWTPDRLHALLGVLQARLRVDPDRVLATGLSRGGRGVWNWAAAYPRDLAAMAPVCGFGAAAGVCRASPVPVRAYHGEADTVVSAAGHRAHIEAFRACGGRADFTLYPGVGHDAWTPAYADPELLPWLLRQRRGPA